MVVAEEIKREKVIFKGDWKLQLVIDNFQNNFGPLTELCKEKLFNRRQEFWTRYVLDLLICNFVVAPCLISFWRGTWDHSLIYLDERLFNVI